VDREDVLRLLTGVRRGSIAPREALRELRWLPYEDLDFARVDTHRQFRTTVPEVVFCEGKTVSRAEAILRRIVQSSGRAMGTRASAGLYARFRGGRIAASYHSDARMLVLGPAVRRRRGLVGVITAGTSDVPVAEEAAITAEFLGASARRIYDVGVAGLHRLAAARSLLSHADALVVVAGMEGALPSVVGGMAEAPVIAVPTSVGYGASFRGLAALLTMINSCAPGVAVVNIDNGFGAGYLAGMIARKAACK